MSKVAIEKSWFRVLGLRLVSTIFLLALMLTAKTTAAELPSGSVWTSTTSTVAARSYWPFDIAATRTVTKIADTNDAVCDADCSLREAVAVAAAGDTVVFAAGLNGQTITLSPGFGEILVNKVLTITGPGATSLTISGGNLIRIFRVGLSGNLTLSGVTITNGKGGDVGGGIVSDGILTVTNSAFVSNASGSGWSGGGLYAAGGPLTVTGCTFNANTAGFGGALQVINASATVVNSTISGNTATGDAGGINFESTNQGARTFNLYNSTIANNTAPTIGALRVNGGGTAATANLQSNIFSGNSATSIVKAGSPSTVNSQGFNLSSDGGGGFLIQSTDLKNISAGLGPLTNNGGPTQTHALLGGSPALDKGSKALSGQPTDQRGGARTADLGIPNASGGDGTDIGAYEATSIPSCTLSSTPIAFGGTANGTLQLGDCNLEADGSYYDAYTFTGTTGQQIAISMNSSAFNAYLILVQGNYPGGSFLIQDNDGGGGTNARIPATSGFFNLPANGTYTILANSAAVGETGAYTLTLTQQAADTTAPTASGTAPNVTTAGATSHTATVVYTDNVSINVSTVGPGDIRITGPNGFNVSTDFQNVTPGGNGTPRTANYPFPVSGGWTSAKNGTYNIVMQANQVADTSGNFVAAGPIGTFEVNIDGTAPTVTVSAPNVTIAGDQYTLSATYVDNVAINAATINTGDVVVSGPQGFSATPSLLILDSTNPASTVAHYFLTPPGGTWDSGDNGTYSIVMQANQVADTSGNFVAAGPIGTFTVNIDSTPPSASIGANNVGSAGSNFYQFSVNYLDNVAINFSTIGDGDVIVTGPNGFSSIATFNHSSSSSNAFFLIVDYRITPPGGGWDISDNGTYSVAVQANQVADTAGNFVPGTVGSFVVDIPGPQPTPGPISNADVTAPQDPIVGVAAALGSPTSSAATVGTVGGVNNYPSTESPDKSIDNTRVDKYLNFGKTGVGFIVTAANYGPQTIVNGLHFSTAGDAPERDPLTVTIEGTNSPNATTSLNSTWTTIYNGVTGLAANPGRTASGPIVSFSNTAAFSSYRVLVTSVRDSAAATSMQFSEVELIGSTLATPKTFTVNNLSNAGPGSLRQAILDANANSPAADTINFAGGLTGTITLAALSEIVISDSVTINGPGSGVMTVSGNSASRILNISSGQTVSVSGLTLTGGNGSNGSGGAIFSSGNLTVANSVITNNSTTAAFSTGGGIHSESSSLTIADTTISNNTSVFIGGGILCNGCTLNMIRTTVNGNSSAGGGGLNFQNGAGSIVNSTISGNTSSGNGGGLMFLVSDGSTRSLQLSNSTIANNTGNNGGGIRNAAQNTAGGSATLLLKNTIIAGNTVPNLANGTSASATATTTSQGFNLASDSGSGLLTGTGDQINTNPLLGPLANNGGPTRTHALLAGSPAIDKGSNAGAGAMTDQRGLTRLRDLNAVGNTSGGDGSDIGAYEEQNEPAATPPTAFATSPNVSTGGVASQTVTVTYSDDIAVNASTINTGDITVTGPSGTVTPTFVSLSPAGNGTPRTATYTFTPLSGRWRSVFNGTYNIVMQANQVADTSGSFVAAGTIGSFTVNVPSASIGGLFWSDNDADGIQDAGEPGISNAFVFVDSNVNGVFDSGELLAQTNSQGRYNFSDLDPGSYTIRVRTVPLGFTATTPTFANVVLNTPTQVVDTADFGFRLVVTDLSDAGPGSLRQTILTANQNTPPGVEVISFQAGLTGTIVLTSGELLMTDSVTVNGPGAKVIAVSGNNASRIFNINAGLTVNINGVSVTGGNATDGAGIRNAGNLTVNSVTISGNNASNNGGGIFSVAGSLTVANSTFTSNSAPNNSGGGIYSQDETATLVNSTISGNTGFVGGGITTIGTGAPASMQITSCTIANNVTPEAGNGGGIRVRDQNGFSSNLQIKNTILDNNSAENILILGSNATVDSLGFNLSSDVGGARLIALGDQINTSALLDSLRDNGGPTQTHALLFGSPAIDKGIGSGLIFDQRGLSRIIDLSTANANGGDGTDIGAFEVQAETAPPFASISGRVFTPSGGAAKGTRVTLIDSAGNRTPVAANQFGIYTITNVPTGQIYTLTAGSKQYRFPSKNLTVNGDLTDVNFTGIE